MEIQEQLFYGEDADLNFNHFAKHISSLLHLLRQ